MSGGSYDYVEYKLGDNPLGYEGLSQLERMANNLLDPLGDYRNVAGAAEIGAQLNAARAQLLTLRKLADKIVEKHAPLMHAVEWEASGDWGPDALLPEWHKFLGIKPDDNGSVQP